MKIVIDARIRPTSTGRYVDGLLRGLQEIDHRNKYLVILDSKDNWRPKNENFEVITVKFPQFSFNLLNDIRFSFMLYRLKANVVHFGMTQQPLFYFGKIVTTTHDLGMIKFLRPGKYKGLVFVFARFMYKFLVKFAHIKSKYIVVPTKYVKQDILKWQSMKPEKIVVTLEAADKLMVSKAIQIPELVGKKFFLYVGTVFPHKNAYRLVDAFGQFQKDNPEVYLIFIGKTEKYYLELKEYIQQKKYTKIYTLGFQPDEKLVWAYQNCIAVTVPSLNEGFGLSGLEAMQYGAPVISSNYTCLPEVYGDAALYFVPTDMKQIVDCLNEVYHNLDRRQELIQAGYQQVNKYSWTKMAKQTLKIYTKLNLSAKTD